MNTKGKIRTNYYAVAKWCNDPDRQNTELWGRFAMESHAAWHTQASGGKVVEVTEDIEWYLAAEGASAAEELASPAHGLRLARDIACWMLGDDTGVSSMFMAAVALAGELIKTKRGNAPHDHSDLGRCIRLVEFAPDVRQYFPVLRTASPIWRVYVDHWAELVATWTTMDQDATNRRMRELRTLSADHASQLERVKLQAAAAADSEGAAKHSWVAEEFAALGKHMDAHKPFNRLSEAAQNFIIGVALGEGELEAPDLPEDVKAELRAWVDDNEPEKTP